MSSSIPVARPIGQAFERDSYTAPWGHPPPPPPVPLTPRQLAIADLVCRGFTNAEIARAFGISPNTVRNRLADAYQRLSVTTRAEFVGIVLGLQR